jgi:hypothetical protein
VIGLTWLIDKNSLFVGRSIGKLSFVCQAQNACVMLWLWI